MEPIKSDGEAIQIVGKLVEYFTVTDAILERILWIRVLMVMGCG